MSKSGNDMKVLWIKHSNPDSYVGPTFLSDLKRNHNVSKYHYSTVISDASVLLVSLSLAVVFLLTFIAIYQLDVKPHYFVALTTLADVPLANKWIQARSKKGRIAALKSGLIAAFAIMTLAPVLRSLTESTSSDSIWALCGWLIFLSVLVSARSSPALSTNTTLAATIVLASRLKSSLDVFSFVLFSIETLVTLPLAFKWLQHSEHSLAWRSSLLLLISISSWILIVWILGWLALTLWIFCQLIVIGGIPVLFLSLQKHKDRISGPWDRAKPVLN